MTILEVLKEEIKYVLCLMNSLRFILSLQEILLMVLRDDDGMKEALSNMFQSNYDPHQVIKSLVKLIKQIIACSFKTKLSPI